MDIYHWDEIRYINTCGNKNANASHAEYGYITGNSSCNDAVLSPPPHKSVRYTLI